MDKNDHWASFMMLSMMYDLIGQFELHNTTKEMWDTL